MVRSFRGGDTILIRQIDTLVLITWLVYLMGVFVLIRMGYKWLKSK